MCWIAATNWKIIDIEHDFIGAKLGKLRAMEAQTHGMSIAKMSTGIRSRQVASRKTTRQSDEQHCTQKQKERKIATD